MVAAFFSTWFAQSPVLYWTSAEAARVPAGRMVTPEDVAAAILFLCSPAAEMIRGQTLVVDGGQSLLLWGQPGAGMVNG